MALNAHLRKPVRLLRAADQELLRQFNRAPFTGKMLVRPATISTRRQTDLAAKAWELRRLKRTIAGLNVIHTSVSAYSGSAAAISLAGGSLPGIARGAFLAAYAIGNTYAIYAQSRILRQTREHVEEAMRKAGKTKVVPSKAKVIPVQRDWKMSKQSLLMAHLVTDTADVAAVAATALTIGPLFF